MYKRQLRYLAGTIKFDTTYKKGGFTLTALSDANWGSNPDNGKSMSSCIMMMSNGSVSFKVVFKESRPNEPYRRNFAAAITMKEAVYCANMMQELGIGEEFKCVPLHIDSNSALHVSGNNTLGSPAHHVALKTISHSRDRSGRQG